MAGPYLAAFLLAGPLLAAAPHFGIKMTAISVINGHGWEQTIYWQTDRKRTEYRSGRGQRKADGSLEWIYGPRLAAIVRCDLQQTFELNLDDAQYVSAPYPPKPIPGITFESRGLSMKQSPGLHAPTLRIETTTVDTGERKDFFGQLARHIIETRKQIPLEGSHSERQEIVSDGWYIDLDLGLSCDPAYYRTGPGHAVLVAGVNTRRIERFEFVDIGRRETGFSVERVATTYSFRDHIKRQESKWESRVDQLHRVPPDPAIFEVPPGFTRVKEIRRSTAQPRIAEGWNAVWQRVKDMATRSLLIY
jgi:hypothetical protein